MPEKQQTPKPFITPLGKFAHPRLTTPDTKFYEAGVYSVRLILDAKTAEPLIRQIAAAIQDSVAQAKKDNPRVKTDACRSARVPRLEPAWRRRLTSRLCGSKIGPRMATP